MLLLRLGSCRLEKMSSITLIASFLDVLWCLP